MIDLTFNGKDLGYNGNNLTYTAVYQIYTNKCSADKLTGVVGDIITVTGDEPAWNERFSGYSITGATLTGNSFMITGSDISVQAEYETAKNVTTASDGHGTITATPNSGFTGTTVTLSNTPSTNYTFQNYAVTGANLTGNQFTLTGSDVTARANFEYTPTYTSKNAPNYFMSTRASAWMDSDVGKVKFTETDSALHYDLPFGTTAATHSYYLMPTDDKSATFLENSGLFEGYKVTHMTAYPGYDRYSGKYLNTSAVVNRVVFGVVPWIYLSNTATTRDVTLYTSVNDGPMSTFVTFYNASAGSAMYMLAPAMDHTFPQPITVAKGNRISINVYCPDTAVSASIRAYGDPHWSGTMSGIGG